MGGLCKNGEVNSWAMLGADTGSPKPKPYCLQHEEDAQQLLKLDGYVYCNHSAYEPTYRYPSAQAAQQKPLAQVQRLRNRELGSSALREARPMPPESMHWTASYRLPYRETKYLRLGLPIGCLM